MKPIYRIFGTLALGTVLAAGCSDKFLQKDSLVAISSGTFWQTEEDAASALTACYDGLQSNWIYNGGPWQCGPLNLDCMTDNGGHFNWSGWMAGYDICNGIHSSTSWLIGDYWKARYEVIKRCNKLISNVDRCDMAEALKSQYKAEATVIRALMYNELTSTYNDVPYLKTEQSITDANCPKTARAEIVADLITDVKSAAEALPVDAELGHVTKGAALAILGRIALYNEKWDEAISAYEQVIALGKYRLFDDYSTLFSAANEGCDEIVFSVRFEGPGKEEGSSIGAHWDTPLEAMNGTIDLADEYYVKSTGLRYADSEIYTDPANRDLWAVRTDRYEDRDPRLRATLFVPGMAWGSADWLYGGAAASFSTIYVQKYFTSDENSSTSWDSDKDFYVVRYAEVLLGLAEAYIEKGTKLTGTDGATGLIDQVRARVGMPSVESVEGATSQADLREVVRHERRVETAFEGLRIYDVYRWKILEDAVNRINAEKERYGFNYETRNYRGPQEYVWPIPQTEIDSNKELKQNKLWGGEE
jgi:starch-binding outer membrane protein, SusD/RagB family